MIPADCPVSEGLAPLPYLALLGVGGVSGVISGALSGTASPECAIGGMRSLCRHLGQPANPIFSLLEQLARGYETWTKESLAHSLLKLLTAVLFAVILPTKLEQSAKYSLLRFLLYRFFYVV
ncbi:hypothetical protein [Microcoleus sp. S13C4]|uniref:hypothetical protein n=1 Tax=Microcoleus sp. S13C4 TaxID=3055410 RepID=UPI002FD6ACE1